MKTANVTYQGRLRTEAIHGASANRLLTDAPTDNHGRGEAFSPTDLLATSLASCMMTIMGIVADRQGIDLTGSQAEVQKHMAPDGPRRVAGIDVALYMRTGGPLAPEQQQQLENAARTCPVARSLHPDIGQQVTFSWEEGQP